MNTKSHNEHGARTGFTLVEVLLAVTILSLVMVGVYGIWSASLKAWKRGGEATEVFQRQRVVMETLAELAQSTVYFAASPELYEVIGAKNPGLGDSVSFVTSSDAFLPPSEANDVGMRRVIISMERDEYQRTYLSIVNQPALSVKDSSTKNLQAHVVSMDVSGFFVRYLDPRDGDWYDKWEESSILPSAMEFTVTFGKPGDQIPPVTVTRAIDLPVADFIAHSSNPGLAPLSSTNEVPRGGGQPLGQQGTMSSGAPRSVGRALSAGRFADDRGIAIVIVLWIVLVLSLLISGFAFTMHVETQVASYARKELKAEMLARSGIEVARMQLILGAQSPTNSGFDALNQDWATNELMYVDHELGDGMFNVKVTDEESKIPINRATDVQLKRLFGLLGVEPSDGDVIVDSILDWIDDDDLTRLNGAESDYYQSLSPPYRAKNGPLDRVEELLLIRGVTPELYKGTPATDKDPAVPGLPDIFSTMTSGAINVNTASAIVLQAMLGLDEGQVQAVISHRDGADGIPGTEDDMPFRNPADFFAAVGNLPPAVAQAAQSFVSVTSSFFTIKSTGQVGGVKRTILATLHRDGTKVQVVMWREIREGS